MRNSRSKFAYRFNWRSIGCQFTDCKPVSYLKSLSGVVVTPQGGFIWRDRYFSCTKTINTETTLLCILIWSADQVKLMRRYFGALYKTLMSIAEKDEKTA